MKTIIVGCLMTLSASLGWSDDGKGSNMQNQISRSSTVSLRAGQRSFAVTLQENQSANSFQEMLPMTIRMKDLNNNEKYYDFPKSLPTNAYNPKSIRAGDIMLYGSNTLVVFYKSFPTSYSYTRLGQINDVANLEAALGSEGVTVTFGLE